MHLYTLDVTQGLKTVQPIKQTVPQSLIALFLLISD